MIARRHHVKAHEDRSIDEMPRLRVKDEQRSDNVTSSSRHSIRYPSGLNTAHVRKHHGQASFTVAQAGLDCHFRLCLFLPFMRQAHGLSSKRTSTRPTSNST